MTAKADEGDEEGDEEEDTEWQHNLQHHWLRVPHCGLRVQHGCRLHTHTYNPRMRSQSTPVQTSTERHVGHEGLLQ